MYQSDESWLFDIIDNGMQLILTYKGYKQYCGTVKSSYGDHNSFCTDYDCV